MDLIASHLATSPSSVPVLTDTRVAPPRGLNSSLYLDLNHFSQHTAWAHGFMHHYALWLGPLALVVVFAATYAVAWWRRAPRACSLLILGAIGTIVALGLNQVIGHAVREPRPYVAHPHALVLVARTGDYAFPSDHAVLAGGLTFAVLLVLSAKAWQRRRPVRRGLPDARASDQRVPAVVRAFAVVDVVLGLFLCFARVYVGAHYPGDVVAGYLLAGVVVLAVSLLRPLAYGVVDLIDPTLVGALVRRPGAAPTSGDPALGAPLGPAPAGEGGRGG